MRLRYPKLVACVFVFYLSCFIVAGVVHQNRERRYWPPSVPNPSPCIIADYDCDTQARAEQIVAAIEQFVRVNGYPPGSIWQLKPTYIDWIISPQDQADGWWFAWLPGGGWEFGYQVSFWFDLNIHTYNSKSREWTVQRLDM